MAITGASHQERERCPLYTAIQVISGRWKPMVFRRLTESGALGFGELRRSMPGVTAKVLRQQLRQMESAGLIARLARAAPLRVEYRLTPHGRSLGPVFETLWSWGVNHLAQRRGEQRAVMRRTRRYRSEADPGALPR
jgi:DNA-binding HxlR family transcriptional regulator